MSQVDVTVNDEVISVLVTVSPEQIAKEFALQAEAAAAAAAVSEFNAAASAAAALASEQAAELAEDNAAASASTATAQAGIATTQAGIATTQAGIATTQASNALASANAALASQNAALASQNAAAASASTATAQANIATTQASNALASANAAAASAAAAAQVGTSTLLTGFSAGSNTAIVATDSILNAFNKTQGQLNARAVISGTPVAGQVAFWGSASAVAGNSNLTYDSANNVLRVGTSIANTLRFEALGQGVFRLLTNGGITIGAPDTQNGIVITANSVNTERFDIRRYPSRVAFLANSSATAPGEPIGFYLFNNGNFAINTATDAGFRLDVNGTARISGALTTNLTAGRVPFVGTGGVLSDDAGLVWDNTSKRLTVTSNQTGAASATFRIDNSGTLSNQAALEFYTSTSDAATSFRGGRIYNVFDGGGFANARVTVQTMQTGNTLLDTISFKNGLVGVRTNDPIATLHVNGTTLLNGLQTFQGTTASDTAPLGSELTTTGTGAGWTGSGFATGYAHTAGLTDPLTTSLAAVIGTYYQIAYTITGRTAGSITINYGGTSTAGITATGATGPLASSTANLEIVPTSDFNGTVVLSVRTIGTSSATTSFNNSSGSARLEIRTTATSNNTVVGLIAGRRITTGTNNTFIGNSVGLNNTTGSSNSFLGNGAGLSNSTGLANCFFGVSAGLSNTIGSSNNFYGVSAGQNVTSGSSNCLFGASAGSSLSVSISNSFFGTSAGRDINTGDFNVIVGERAGLFISSGASLTALSNSVLIGRETRPNANSESNQIIIGHNSIGLGSNTTVIGNASTTFGRWFGNLLIGTSVNAGFGLDVNGTARISGALTTNLTAGRVPFVGTAGVLSDDAGMAWNNTLKTLTLTTTGGTIRPLNLNFLNGTSFVGNNVGEFVFNVLQVTSSSGSASFQPRNNGSASGSFVTYSTLEGGNLFGLARANFTALIQSGGNGLMVGVTTAHPLIFGTNDLERARIDSNGNFLIGTNASVASSILTVNSTTQGVLFPRMTSTQRNAIASPATGLVVYNTTDNRLSVYNGSAWVNIDTL